MSKVVHTVLVVTAGLFIAAASMAATGKEPPESANIDGCKAKKPVVKFPHKAHVDAKIDCTECHHTQKDLKAGADVEVKKCSSCHLKPEKPETLGCTDQSPKKNAFHVNCIACHKKEVAKKADSKAPTKCDQCHKK